MIIMLWVLVLQGILPNASARLKITKAESDVLIQSRCATYGSGVCTGQHTSRQQDVAECNERLAGVKEKGKICNHTYIFVRGQMHGGTGVARKVIAQHLKSVSELDDSRYFVGTFAVFCCLFVLLTSPRFDFLSLPIVSAFGDNPWPS